MTLCLCLPFGMVEKPDTSESRGVSPNNRFQATSLPPLRGVRAAPEPER